MAYSQNPIKQNTKGVFYVIGDESTDNSIRFSIDGFNNLTTIEKRIEGLWQPTSFSTGADTLWVGHNVGLAGVGHHLATEATDGHLHFHAHSEFFNGMTTHDVTVVHAYASLTNIIFQPDSSGEWTGTVFESARVATLHSLINAAYYKTGATAGTAPLTLQIWKGTDDTGPLIFRQVFPTSKISTPNTDFALNAAGWMEFEQGESNFFRWSSPETFSLKTNIGVTELYFSADVSLVREENLLQTKEWVSGDSWIKGALIIESRKIYTCNVTGVQTGTFASNSDKWDLPSTSSSIDISTFDRVLTSNEGEVVPDNDGNLILSN